uniref:Cilia- and flagella-associated protein 91 n=1 Tax=Tetradesmus obliquus TaxID=3088 RepID=A0A383WAB7_TETOB
MVTQSRELSVIGLGDPVMDVLFQVDHKFLASIANKAGGCTNITDEELKRLTCMAAEHCDPVRVPGGSAANVMKGLANISAGSVHCKFMGMVGTDAVARDYMQKLEQQNVQPVLLESCEGPTASCLCFVTPDGQRTMRTCLGASAHLTSSSMLPQGWPAGAALLHCEGYCLYRPQLAREAMREAKQAGALVSIDLASFECVANCKQPLLELLQEGLIDLVFANEEEAVALLEVVAGQQGASAGAAAGDAAAQVQAAQEYVLQYAQVCVVSLGPRGCVARARGGLVGTSPAGGVKVVDTIGAGDYFTSGFLYAYLLGCSLQQCAAVGCQAGSEAVQTKGAILSDAAWQRLRSTIGTIVGGQKAAAGGVSSGAASAAAAAAAAADAASSKEHPTYTVSGARDHYRQQSSGGFLIEKVTEHSNLFSELQQYPATSFRLAANDKVPAFVDRSFHPLQRQPGQLRQQSLAQQVNGRQQYKYFRRPQLPPGARLSAPLHLTQQQQPVPEPPAQPEPAIKDAYTQSDYRESEAQTLPWSPDWVLPRDPAVLAKQAVLSAKFNCQGPEVLQLADLKFGDGLPGGLQEVQRLEKLRQKRAFAASLPPIDDAARLLERQALIEAWEAAEWAEREGEIQGVQDERLALLQAALKVREEEIEEAHRAQVEQRSAALLAAKAQKFAAIHSSRIKTIRQLAARRKAVDAAACGSSGNGGSIIDKYADFGSPVYAPLQREGRFPDAIKPSAAVSPAATAAGAGARQLPDVQSLAPSSLAGLQELQASLPSRALQPKLHRPKPPAKLNYSQRAEAAVQQDVETISNLLQSAKATQDRGVGQVWPYPIDQAALYGSCGSGVGGKLGGSRRNVGVAAALGSQGDGAAPQQQVIAGCKGGADSSKAQATRTGERPPTPGAPPLPDADGQHAALVLLQRLLRGRAVQNEMYTGKTSRLQLIRELRLGLEGTAGHQQRPEMRDAATQELDAAIGAALCSVCCLLASDDEAAITQLLLGVAGRQQQRQEVQLDQEWLEPVEEPQQSQQQLQQQQQVQAGCVELVPGSDEQLLQRQENVQQQQQQQPQDSSVNQKAEQVPVPEQGYVEEAGVAAAHQHASQEEQQSSLGGSKEEGKQQQQQQQQQEPGLQQCDQQQQVLHPAGKPDPGLGLSELAEQQQHTDDVAGGPAAESSTGETAEGMVQQGSSSQQGTRSDGSASEDAVDTAAMPLGSHAADSSAERHQNSSISTGAEEAQQRQEQPQEYMGVEEDRATEVPVSSAEHESANKALDADSAIDELPPDAQHSAQSPAAAGSWAAGEQVLAEGSSDSVAVAGRAAEASLAGGVLLSGGVLGVLADASCSGSSGHGSGAVSGVGSQFSLGAGVHGEEPESEDAVRTPSMLKPRGLHAMIGAEEDDEQEVTSCSSSSVDRQQQKQQQDAGMQLEASSNSSSSRSSSSSSASEEEEQ